METFLLSVNKWILFNGLKGFAINKTEMSSYFEKEDLIFETSE